MDTQPSRRHTPDRRDAPTQGIMPRPRLVDRLGESRREHLGIAHPESADPAGDGSVRRQLYRMRRNGEVGDPAGEWIAPGVVYEGEPRGERGAARVRLFHPLERGRHYDIRRSRLALVLHDAMEQEHPAVERRFLDSKRVTWIVTAEPAGHANAEGAAPGEPTPEGVLVFSSPVETRRLTRTIAHRAWLEAPSADLRAWCRTASCSRAAR
jgi:hypothetical protein